MFGFKFPLIATTGIKEIVFLAFGVQGDKLQAVGKKTGKTGELEALTGIGLSSPSPPAEQLRVKGQLCRCNTWV